MCGCYRAACLYFFFFFNDTATTEIYTLSLHDALPIYTHLVDAGYVAADQLVASRRTYDVTLLGPAPQNYQWQTQSGEGFTLQEDRKSTRLNSSHANISYAVFCLKKKKRNATRAMRIAT